MTFRKEVKNILITGGAFSNKGTQAIVITTVEGIKREFPIADIYVELLYPEKESKIIESDRVKIVTYLKKNPSDSSNKDVKQALLEYLVKNPKEAVNLFFFPLFALFSNNIYKKIDIVVDISAEMFVSFYHEKTIGKIMRIYPHLIPFITCKLLRKSVFVMAQTIGDLGTLNFIQKYFILDQAQIISTREEISLNYVKDKIKDKSKLHLVMDPAFLLKSISPETAMQFLEKEGIPINEKGKTSFIGITVTNPYVEKLYNINIIEIFAKALDNVVEETNSFVVFIPHSTLKVKDFALLEKIQDSMEHRDKTKILLGDYNAIEIKGIIGQLDAMVGIRMHSIIAAISMGIPSILIGFNQKAFGVMEMLDQTDWIFDIRELSPDTLTFKILELLAQKNRISRQLNKDMKKVYNLSDRNFQLLKEWAENQ